MVGEVASSFFAKRVCAGVDLVASRSWTGGIAPAKGLGGDAESTKNSPNSEASQAWQRFAEEQ